MKKISKAQIFVWILALVPLVLAAAVYGRLPAQIPMSWDFGGEVGYEPKWHLWLIAGLSPLLAALFYGMPALDPKRRNYNKFFGSYIGFQLMMMLFLIIMNGICVVAVSYTHLDVYKRQAPAPRPQPTPPAAPTWRTGSNRSWRSGAYTR